MAGLGRLGFCGAEGDRTLDLVNAIHALSQLSYSPRFSKNPSAANRNNIIYLWVIICKYPNQSWRPYFDLARRCLSKVVSFFTFRFVTEAACL